MRDEDRASYDEWLKNAYTNTPAPPLSVREATMEAARAEVGVVYRKTPEGERAVERPRWPRGTRVALYAIAACGLMAAVLATVEIVKMRGTRGVANGAAQVAIVPKEDVPGGSLPRVNASQENPSHVNPSPAAPRDSGAVVLPEAGRHFSGGASSGVVPSGNLPNTRTSQLVVDTSNAPPAKTAKVTPSVPMYADVLQGLDGNTTKQLTQVIDRTVANDLPITALLSRIREGIQRGIPSARIVVVARNYADALDTAQHALGSSTSNEDLQLAAEAMLAGVPGNGLHQLRSARPHGSLVEPLLALTDLASHGVAPLSAATALATMMHAGNSDAGVRALRTAVVGSILKGVAPDVALARSVQQQGMGKPPAPKMGQSLDSLQRNRMVP